jgi:gas vesicle protein
METLLIIGALILVVVGISIYLTRSGKVEDKNNNMIPDKVEEKVNQAKQATKNVANETKNRAKRVVQESKDVARAAKEVVKQSKDVVDAAKGGKRKGRKKSNNQNKGKN